MKNMFYFFTLLFLMGSCTPESDLGNFQQQKDLQQTKQEQKACTLDIDCSYAFQITEEGCLFDLWDILEQLKQKNCPGATLSWKKGTQPWVNLGQGEEYLTVLNVQNCEGLTCKQYTVKFSCEDTCTTVDCNYNIDVIEGQDACEYAITFDCDTQLEVDGNTQQSIPLGNGVCAVILTLDQGESSDLTFTTEDGQECTETITCGNVPCDCDRLDLQVLKGKDPDGCCIFTLKTVIPPDFGCPHNDFMHGLTYFDGTPVEVEEIGSGSNWTRFRVCNVIGNPQTLIGTIELFQNGASVCGVVNVKFKYNGCQ